MKVDGTLLKDLDIFDAVVKSNGITNAQYILNKDASTISRSISSLEVRTGITICERGRAGFRVTPEGEQLLNAFKKLSNACSHFEKRVAEISDTLTSNIHFGLIDNIISDASCPLIKILQTIEKDAIKPSINIELVVKTPYELERALLDQSIDIALGIFESKHDSLAYITLYQETDYLYIATCNPLAKRLNNGVLFDDMLDDLSQQSFCARNFLNQSDLESLGFDVKGEISYTENLEAIMLKTLSGNCISFVPSHYAHKYVQVGQLLPIFPEKIKRISKVQIALKKGAREARHSLEKLMREVYLHI